MTTVTACTFTSHCSRMAKTCSQVTAMADCPKQRCTTSAASSSTPRQLTRSRTRRRTVTSAWYRASRLRPSWPIRHVTARRRFVFLTSPTRKVAASKCFPDSTANPYLAFAALMMAGLDGIENKIHPGDAMDKDLYDLPPEEEKDHKLVAFSLEEALSALDRDRDFLTAGD